MDIILSLDSVSDGQPLLGSNASGTSRPVVHNCVMM
jgi:hypothetical protein